MRISIASLVLAHILVLTLLAVLPAQTPGLAEFRVTTLPAPGNYSPRHVLAIWVVDSQGAFVKTLLRRAQTRRQYLYTFQASSADNVVDAVTGATLSTHQAHTVLWNCRNVSGEVVPDGEYRIRVEFTSQHAQGPITPATHIAFTKGTEPFELSPANLTYFTDVSLSYRPELETHTLVAAESVWKYDDTGADLHATDWKLAGHDDSAWREGRGALGYADPVNTELYPGPDPANKRPCYYFRRAFDLEFLPTSMLLRIRRDDGAVVYLNGTEIARENMAPGQTAYGDFATATVGGADELAYFTRFVDPSACVLGTNIVAVEVHQASADSSDLSFDLELRSPPPPSIPTLFIRGDADGDGETDITDAIGTLQYLFLVGSPPACLGAADSNDDGEVDIADAVATLLELFGGGSFIPPPYPGCGEDPTPDDLPCDGGAAC